MQSTENTLGLADEPIGLLLADVTQAVGQVHNIL